MSAVSRSRRAGARRAFERGDRLKLVRFFVGQTVYAVEVGQVEEVVQPSTVTELPDLPPWVLGVGDHRGTVVPIVDLRARFALEPAPPSRGAKWLLVRLPVEGRAERMRVGFLVDRVLDVRGTDEEPRPPPDVAREVARRAIVGVVTIDGAPSFLLELGRLVRELEPVATTPAAPGSGKRAD